jgi:hypothetical protein
MDVHHPHLRQFGCRSHCACDSIGDVVKLEIKENLKAQTREPLDSPRAFRREELETHLEKACRTPKGPRQGAGRPQAVDIQGYD